jgi:rod shape-determining protein MreB
VAIGIPSGVTEVERRAVWEAALSAGARQAYLIEEPMAAAIGTGLPISEASGNMIVDIGGGTAEMAVISLGGIVVNRSIRIAGDEMDEAIIHFMRTKYNLLIGQATAEDLKISIGSAYLPKKSLKTEGYKDKLAVVRGRDIESGLPKSIKVSESEIREALSPVINEIVEAIGETIEEAPPELVGDILERGIWLCGGGSQLPGLANLVAERTRMPVWLAEDPMTCVVRGCGKVLDDYDLLSKVRVTGGLR